jgi:hypothetical protein
MYTAMCFSTFYCCVLRLFKLVKYFFNIFYRGTVNVFMFHNITLIYSSRFVRFGSSTLIFSLFQYQNLRKEVINPSVP